MSVKGLPPGYVRTGRWVPSQLSAWDILLAAVLGMGLLYSSILVVSVVTWATTGSNEITLRGETFVLGIAIGLVLGLALHELAHAATFLMFGARPRFGFKPWTRFGPVFYVSAPGSYVSRAEFATAGLAPPPLLAALLLPVLVLAPAGGLIYSTAWWAFVAGVAGSAGDLIIIRNAMRYGRATYFEDVGDGFAAFGPASGRETD